MKTCAEACTAKIVSHHAHNQSRFFVISKYFDGSFPSKFAPFFRVSANAFNTFCMPGLELLKCAYKASTCAVAGALLQSKFARLSVLFIWLTISQRNIPHLCKCKRRSPSVSSRMSASSREDLPVYHPASLQVQEKISQRIIPHACKRRSPSVSSRMSAGAREDLRAYHPTCLQVQENHAVTTQRYYTPPPLPLNPLIPTPAKHCGQQKGKKLVIRFSFAP